MNLPLFAWFLFMTSASFWLPAYEGDLGGGAASFVPLYALVAGGAAIGVRKRAQSARQALLSALPAAGLLAAAAVAGPLVNEEQAEYRGGPIFLFFGIALWASWAALVLSTALLSRTRWNGLMGIGLGFFVAVLGLFMFVARID
jgi:hypothetical protein